MCVCVGGGGGVIRKYRRGWGANCHLKKKKQKYIYICGLFRIPKGYEAHEDTKMYNI